MKGLIFAKLKTNVSLSLSRPVLHGQKYVDRCGSGSVGPPFHPKLGSGAGSKNLIIKRKSCKFLFIDFVESVITFKLAQQ